MAENTIDNLSIQITANAEQAAKVFDRLASNAGKLKGAASSAAGGMGDLADNVKEVANTAGKAEDQTGEAAKSVRQFGRDAERAGASAKKGTAGIASFWGALKRIAYYRFIRSIIKGITEAFTEGIKNLYHWSAAIDGHFAKAMDRMATSTQYLKNSFAAMVSPLIESFIPVLDVIIDKVVEALNFFNMLFSAISGADTYTVAKKTAAVWEDTTEKTKKNAKKTADEIKRTILGFDEINKLVKPKSSSGSSGSSSQNKQPNYADMFEERPLTGFFKKISDVTKGWPDWLKWLLGIGGAAAVGWGISLLPKLLGKIWDLLKKLFTIHIPDWLRWLFGPKGDRDIDLDLPDSIDLPDADIETNLVKGDWGLLDDLSGEPVYLSPKLDNKPSVLLDNFRDEWNSLFGRILYFFPRFDNTARVLLENFRDDWSDLGGSKTLYFTPRLNNTARVLFDDFKNDWYNIPPVVYVSVLLSKLGWDDVREWLGLDNPISANINLRKWGWSDVRRWIGLDKEQNANVNLRKWGWSRIRTWLGLDNPVTAQISLEKSGWENIRVWLGLGEPVTADINLRKWGWERIRTWLGLDYPVNADIRLVRWGWDTVRSWLGLDNPINANIRLVRWGWSNLQSWIGDSVTVRVNLTMANGGTINLTGRGGGGSTQGGGAGRNRRASGGAFSSGAWSNIPQYAGGTSSAHGSLFLAGEAGPEIVGHVGGRTEVLNKSQLASAMYSAVRSAMSGVSLNASFDYGGVEAGSGNANIDQLVELVRAEKEATQRQNELLRQQNEYLRQLNEKEFTSEITTSQYTRAQKRSNMRAGVAVVPIG